MNKTWWMENETFAKYQSIVKELRDLYREHSELIPKLKNKTATEREWKRVIEINKHLAKLEEERKKILDANPLRPQNIKKYLK